MVLAQKMWLLFHTVRGGLNGERMDKQLKVSHTTVFEALLNVEYV